MEHALPEETLGNIFQDYLSRPEDHLSLRRVCRRWRHRHCVGCAFIRLRRDLAPTKTYIIQCSGNRRQLNKESSSAGEDHSEDETSRQLWGRKRARAKGHLPQPMVICDDDTTPLEKTTISDVQFVAATKILACRMEKLETLNCNKTYHFLSVLDLSASSCIERSSSMSQKVWQMKRVLQEADLSCLHHLKRLSVRGCGGLIWLRLPISLVALDASGCTQMTQISFSVTPSLNETDKSCFVRAQLQTVNLSGCRSLLPYSMARKKSGSCEDTPDHLSRLRSWDVLGMMDDVEELDLSSLKLYPSDIVAWVSFQKLTSLMSLSLRYVATDEMLHQLATTSAAKDGHLRWIDLSFSCHVTDPSIQSLVRGASALQRLNLRGCSGISVECYNNTPLLLQTREVSRQPQHQKDSSTTFLGQNNTGSQRGASMKRKGDTLFHLFNTAHTPRQRRRQSLHDGCT